MFVAKIHCMVFGLIDLHVWVGSWFKNYISSSSSPFILKASASSMPS